MNADGKAQRFPDTRWSLVGRADSLDEAERHSALSELLSAYTPALREFLAASRRIPPDLVEDLVHDFIVDKIFARKLLHHADHSKGKFRNLVMKALSNFASSRLRRLRPEWVTANGLDLSEVMDGSSQPEVERFDKVWVEGVVHETLEVMRKECDEDGRPDIWEMFFGRIVAPMLYGDEPVEYGLLVERLRLESPRQAINLLATGKRSFLRHLRTAVARYVEGDERIEREIADLQAIVNR